MAEVIKILKEEFKTAMMLSGEWVAPVLIDCNFYFLLQVAGIFVR